MSRLSFEAGLGSVLHTAVHEGPFSFPNCFDPVGSFLARHGGLLCTKAGAAVLQDIEVNEHGQSPLFILIECRETGTP